MKVRGKLIWNPKGYGFVESKGLSEDVFIPPEGLNSALDGDLVEVDVYRDRKGLRGRVSSGVFSLFFRLCPPMNTVVRV